MWDKRVNASIINCINESVALKVRKKIMKGHMNLDEIQSKINKKSSLNMDLNKGLFVSGENDFIDQVQWTKGLSDFIYDQQNVKMIYIHEVIPPTEKKLKEAKGTITSDYQDFLEKEWLAELKDKYSVTINSFVFELLKSNRLDELDQKATELPSYSGDFSNAFKQAVSILGSSKDILFQWNGNVYTTAIE